jgi:hypothetical protein
MHLKIYVAEHCWGCDEAQKIATQMRQTYSEVTVEVIDLNGAEVEQPDEIFAIPTYVLNGRVVSLGNPKPEKLRELIEAELGSVS